MKLLLIIALLFVAAIGLASAGLGSKIKDKWHDAVEEYEYNHGPKNENYDRPPVLSFS